MYLNHETEELELSTVTWWLEIQCFLTLLKRTADSMQRVSSEFVDLFRKHDST